MLDFVNTPLPSARCRGPACSAGGRVVLLGGGSSSPSCAVPAWAGDQPWQRPPWSLLGWKDPARGRLQAMPSLTRITPSLTRLTSTCAKATTDCLRCFTQDLGWCLSGNTLRAPMLSAKLSCVPRYRQRVDLNNKTRPAAFIFCLLLWLDTLSPPEAKPSHRF